MTAEGHVLFSVACAILAKKVELSPELAAGDWWHIIPGALLTSLLPDIDHPKSLLGQRLKWISAPIARAFGHRGFTHSLLAIVAGVFFIQTRLPSDWLLPTDAYHAMIVGYLSHIAADLLTSSGVPLLWPCRWRFRLQILNGQKGNQLERFLCIAFIGFSLYQPQKSLNCCTYEQSFRLIRAAQAQVIQLLK
ncbi:metal-dependent hydrolase [Brenneria goodwinii]|uniref:metal-dependent hydrolase n=1 Tax=Brenneria goodwinii TaxID=1109412 RepID=UPI000EF207C7|nr:metal-dependent hydrolase [Brenneria goodwinii]MCG8155290.1 metal-dependent hydrolase [Brenneria goodwinii]MCG8159534.1 metal-dependent hydrolase [Brenneria goodwinii]MCG8164297.1 metal-dependent hydrolase [Brenneria goodwinii]MCG8169137.1 metal-dependent hydrolase [Brenneria goodwinii]MCG8173393.1 metal-dependent hydrolase [Brenneria goodwinii]